MVKIVIKRFDSWARFGVREETHFVTFNQNISVGIPNLQLTIIRCMACKSQLDNMHLASYYFLGS
jgi:hypothetical protein